MLYFTGEEEETEEYNNDDNSDSKALDADNLPGAGAARVAGSPPLPPPLPVSTNVCRELEMS